MASVTEIAKRLNISPASVSRALNGQPGISETTRSRILAEVERLNFVPHGAARSLASTRAENIGFTVYHQPSQLAIDPFYSRILLGVEQEVRQHKFHLLLTALEDDQVARPMQWSLLHGKRVDGLILAGPFIPSRFILAIHAQGTPLVLVDNAVSGAPIDVVLGDDQGGAQAAAQHILGHGHRRVVILSGPTSWITSRERCQGFTAALSEQRITPLATLHADATTYETGYALMGQALSLKPTAVLAINDAMAMGAIDAARQAGLSVPDDLAVTGFDDVESAERFHVPLTTVHIPKQRLGQIAARRLFERIDDRDGPQQRTLVATTLVVRRSCGCEAPA
ncbi:MAG: LacI family DNA-binding transcriptional regulator [Chloroflexi bacterium]|nr:LacI family DNA-binding transcriptional regulator [Chloroflexota bacterium]